MIVCAQERRHNSSAQRWHSDPPNLGWSYPGAVFLITNNTPHLRRSPDLAPRPRNIGYALTVVRRGEQTSLGISQVADRPSENRQREVRSESTSRVGIGTGGATKGNQISTCRVGFTLGYGCLAKCLGKTMQKSVEKSQPPPRKR